MRYAEKATRGSYLLAAVFIGMISCLSCKDGSDGYNTETGRYPVIEPDYTDVTIPPAIAPLNFVISEDAEKFRITAISGSGSYIINIKSRDGIIRFREKAWKKLVDESRGDTITVTIRSSVKSNEFLKTYKPFYIYVSDDPIDSHLVYRLINPGYYSWSNIRIVQRSLGSFWEESIIENSILEKNCANCHSFNNNSSDRFLVHIRGSLGGTYFVENGAITRTDPKIDAMPGGATYPSWHPGGRFVAFSSNQVRQSFYSVPEKTIEVFDLVSSLIIYDRGENEVISLFDSDTTKYLETFPSWSPDGRSLYFCRAYRNISASDPELGQIMNTHYDLVRRTFDPATRSFEETEIIFKASEINKSVSFPRVSPDGRFLIFTLQNYGTFPIWHQEADLHILDMQSGETRKMDLNSSETESYHTWSRNGRWLVFSSKRGDGRSARPHFVHIDSLGNEGKPFVLPQRDPMLYTRMLESFNIPEFVNDRIKIKPRDFAVSSKQTSLKAKSGNPKDFIPEKPSETGVNERPIHE